MTQVIKKGGKRKQVFNAAKIRHSIEIVAKDVNLAQAKIKELIRDVAEPTISFFKTKRTVKATDIRRSLLRRLDRKAKAVSRAWRNYDKKKRNKK